MIRPIAAILLALASLTALLPETREEETAVVICVLEAGSSVPDVEVVDYLPEREATAEETEHTALVCGILRESAPQAQLYLLRCLYDGIGESEAHSIAQALYDAVDVYHADVVNISWTLNQPSEPLHQAIRYAHDRGVILVAAAGNLSAQTPLGSAVYPAAWDEVIGVGGVDVDEEGAPVSSLWYLHSEAVFLCADGRAGDRKGSSFAAPRVSAWIAGCLSTLGNATDSQIRERIKAAVTDAGEEGYDPVFGWGYLDTRKSPCAPRSPAGGTNTN